MTKKDYAAIAAIIRAAHEKEAGWRPSTSLLNIARDLADHCANDNERFDRARFMLACGLKATD